MAIINCPHCGKSISDRAEVCQFCGKPLAKPQARTSKDIKKLTAVKPAAIKEIVVSCCLALVLTLVSLLLIRIIGTALMRAYVGESGVNAVYASHKILRLPVILGLVVGTVLMAVVPILAKRIIGEKLCLILIGALLACGMYAIGAGQTSGIIQGIIPLPDFMMYAGFGLDIYDHLQAYSKFWPFAMPLLLTALAVAGHNRSVKSAVISEVVFCVANLGMWLIASYLLVAVFNYSAYGLSFASMISTVVTLAAVLIVSAVRKGRSSE